MRSTFFGIELSKRALFAQQRAMDVASHNIANANNPVYSRQRAVMVQTAPYAPPGSSPASVAGQVGTGVHVTAVERLRDQFLDSRIRRELSLAGRWQVRQDVLEQVERLVGEPSDVSLRAALDAFWKALEDLSVAPESLAVREVVVQRGQALGSTVGHVFRQLEQLRVDLDRTLELKVGEVNAAVSRLAELNGQIARIAASGQRPNDLMDERDGLLERLSQLLPVTILRRPVGPDNLAETVAVSLGGLTLVDGEQSHPLVLAGSAPERTLHWETGTGPQVSVADGEMGAYLELRGTLQVNPTPPPDFLAQGFIPELMVELDRWIRTLAEEINTQHQAGYTLDGTFAGPPAPIDFFQLDADGDGWVADDLQVDPGVAADPTRIAAAGEDPPGSFAGPGDGSNALAMAQIKFKPLVGLGGVTAPDFLSSLVGSLGVRAQEARNMTDSQELVMGHLRTLRDAVSGVSLDEEMADLIRFEHAYGAAARAMTALDEVLDTLINRTGVVGR